MTKLVSTSNMTKDEWLIWRNKGIGGSDASIVCGINKYKSPIQLWMEKTGQLESDDQSEAAYWGNILEPIVRKEFSSRTNLKVKREPFMLQHPKYEFMLANVDGIVNHPELGKCIFEAKTASVFKQDQWEDDKIPDEYMLQIQHYMAVTGYMHTYIAVLIGGNQFKYKLIKRDDEIIDMLIKLEVEFWEHVKNNTLPPIDGSEASVNLLNKLYPNASKNTQVELPAEALSLINQYEEYQEKEKEILEKKDYAANELKAMIGNYEQGTLLDRTVIWKNIASERLDSKKLKAEMPEIFEKYSYSNEYRRFSIK